VSPVIDATNLRRSAREKGEDKVKRNVGQFTIIMEFKCRYNCFLISRKDVYMKSLFQSWNKSFSNYLSLKNRRRSKYCAKRDKTEEYWAQKEEEFNQESTDQLLDDSFDFKAANYLDLKCDTKREL